MTDAVLFEQEGPIAIITLNRPEARNAISDAEVIDSLVHWLGRIDSDLSVRVAILTGAGTAFSSGGNIKNMARSDGLMSSPLESRRYYLGGIHRIPLAFSTLEVPIIAAVNGPAMGAGCDVACMCDIRIAAQSAKFAESFVKMGLVSGDGGAWLLPHILGSSKAREMAFTGDSIDAEQALACGLVSMVVDDKELLETARKLAHRIARNPPHAVRMTKRLMNEAQYMTFPSLLHLSATAQAIVRTTEDHREAVAAFKEKRKPNFTGR